MIQQALSSTTQSLLS